MHLALQPTSADDHYPEKHSSAGVCLATAVWPPCAIAVGLHLILWAKGLSSQKCNLNLIHRFGAEVVLQLIPTIHVILRSLRHTRCVCYITRQIWQFSTNAEHMAFGSHYCVCNAYSLCCIGMKYLRVPSEGLHNADVLWRGERRRFDFGSTKQKQRRAVLRS